MGRKIQINPVTRIEGHAKVSIDLGDDGSVTDANLHVIEFRGFEAFVRGMQAEQMPTLTARICGTCPHAHHLVSAKLLDKAFSVEPPRAAVLLRELMSMASFLHSHAIHFFALAGPDLLLDKAGKRGLFSLVEAEPELATKALRLRTLGQKISETVGGRGTHPVTAVAGGMTQPLRAIQRDKLAEIAAEALELSFVALEEGKRALVRQRALLESYPLAIHDSGTTKDGVLDIYDGALRVTAPDGSEVAKFQVEDYRSHFQEEALPSSYAKQVKLMSGGSSVPFRVGPLSRLNVNSSISTPRANDELCLLKERYGSPCSLPVMGHYARLIEMVYAAERAVEICADPELISTDVRATSLKTPKAAMAHVEAPRGTLIHDYDIDSEGLIKSANLIVATQQNLAPISQTIRSAAEGNIDKSDDDLIGAVEFAIRCYDPCLSCSTHRVGEMPIEVTISHRGDTIRHAARRKD